MAEPVSPSAPTPTPCKSPMVGLYPLITETKVARSGLDRRPATTMQVYTHVPFNPVDLAAFKAQAGEFSTNPSRFISVFEGCLSSHKLEWDDCNVLLRTLLSEVERQQVVSKAREEAQRLYDRDRINVPDPNAQVPRADPRWDPNDHGDMTRLTSYKELLLHGLRHSAVRHNNWAKPYEVMQDLKESPGAFLQSIRDTIRQNTNADPDDQATESIIKGIFTSRAAPDIKRKLQKKEDLMGMTMAQILETANRAYSLRETEKERKQVRLMVTAVQAGTKGSGRGGRGRGRERPASRERRLGRNQCALCRQEGHWKNECPKRKEKGGCLYDGDGGAGIGVSGETDHPTPGTPSKGAGGKLRNRFFSGLWSGTNCRKSTPSVASSRFPYCGGSHRQGHQVPSVCPSRMRFGKQDYIPQAGIPP
ncbi:unnamed protein product [Caretta caretta]